MERVDRQLFGRRELKRLIDPASVAVIGASSTAGSFGLRAVQNIGMGYRGQVFPINPRHKTILEHPCYASIKELPQVPDCALLAIPRDHVQATLEQCAALGVGGAVIFSSGFAELGTPEGIRDQQNMTALARESGMRICGPNCMGIFNIASRVGMSFQPGFHTMHMVDGPLGLVSQSGALGYILMQALERGLGFTHYLSPGNSCDVDVCDLVNYLIEDENTRAIACTFEGIRSGARLIEVCRRAWKADKPLIVYKMGASEISKRTAMSHTGSLAGDEAAYRAVFEETGVVTVDNFEAILETTAFFTKVGKPSVPGVGVLAASGGSAVIAADKAAFHGVELPQPAAETSARLARVIPAYGSSQNPADITAEALRDMPMYGECVKAFAEDPAFGAVVVPMMSAYDPPTVERARYLCELAKDLRTPICVVWMSEWYEGPGSEVYDSSPHVSTFRSMDRCIATLASWIRRSERKALDSDASHKLADQGPAQRQAREILRTTSNIKALTERESKQVLAAYGVRVTRETLATSADAAVAAAASIGYPVVLKAESADIPHKTEAGVVRLDVKSDDEVRRAYDEIMAAAGRVAGKPLVAGVVVQEMVKSGVEMMIGIRQDPQFGTLVVCGLGGIFVELLKDVAIALAPVNPDKAANMLASLKGYPLLKGFRGSKPVNVAVLCELISRVSQLGVDLADEIEEIDVNPVIVDALGGAAVDALVVRRMKSQVTR